MLLSCSHVVVLSHSRDLSLNPELTHSSGLASELLSVLPSTGLIVATAMPVFPSIGVQTLIFMVIHETLPTEPSPHPKT